MMYKILKIFFKNQDDVWMTNVKEQDRDDDNLPSLHHLDFCNTFFIIIISKKLLFNFWMHFLLQSYSALFLWVFDTNN